MIELRSGRLRAQVQPEAGGALAGVWRDAEPLLSSLGPAVLPLVPFSNRVGHASVVWQGTEQPLIRHAGDAPHAIVGVAASRAWEVLEEDASSAMLAYAHRPDAAWPFAFDCSHTVRLQAGRLDLTLAITNQSGRPAPAGVGWRLRFPAQAGRRVAFHAGSRWEFDGEQLPLRLLPAIGVDADTASLCADDAYEAWSGVAELRNGGAALRVTSPLGRLLLVAGANDDDALVLAPVTHAPNAVHLHAMGAARPELGLRILQPGETLVAQAAIEVDAA
jgi:aldose 1-epimerase